MGPSRVCLDFVCIASGVILVLPLFLQLMNMERNKRPDLHSANLGYCRDSNISMSPILQDIEILLEIQVVDLAKVLSSES